MKKEGTVGQRKLPQNLNRLILLGVATLMLQAFLSIPMKISQGDPIVLDNGNETETAIWEFGNESDYTGVNVSLLPRNAILSKFSRQFIDTSLEDFNKGTLFLNVDTLTSPGKITINNTLAAGELAYLEFPIEILNGTDSWISGNGGQGDMNWGVSQNLDLAISKSRRALVGFDLPLLSGMDVITYAVVKLKLSSAASAFPLNVSVHQLTQPWTEGTGDNQVTGDGVTWYSRDGVTNWTQPGGDFNSTPEDVVYLITDQPNWYVWNITKLVRAWSNGTKPNYGVILIPQMAGVGPQDEKEFHSKESAVQGSQPRFGIEYLMTEGGVANGTYFSSVFAATSYVNWDNISWNASVPFQTNLYIYTRTGDCSGNWSSWSAPYSSSGSQVTSPPGRCIQYRVDLETFNRTKRPILEEIIIRYSGYRNEGFIETNNFTPTNLISWEEFDATFEMSPGTSIRFSYSTDSGGSWISISPGDDLLNVSSSLIRVRANLSTTNLSLTPKLNEIKITYQVQRPLEHIHMPLSTWTGTTDETVDLDAIGHDQFDREVDFQQKWETDDPWGSVNQTGFYRPGMVGTWRVYCNNSDNSVSNYTTVIVLIGMIARIEIQPWSVGVLTTDDVQDFSAIGFDSKGNFAGSVSVNWSVSGNIGSVSSGPAPTSSFDPTKPGQGRIIAEDVYGHVNTTDLITVLAGKLDTIDIEPNGITIKTESSQYFTAVGRDADNNIVELLNPVWETNGGEITNSTSFSAYMVAQDQPLQNGWIKVTAIFQNNITGIANFQVVLEDAMPHINGKIPDQERPEDFGSWSIDLSSYASDPYEELSQLTWSFSDHDISITTITGDEIEGNHLITFTTVPNAYGSDEVTIHLRNSAGYVDSQTFYINITPVNDRPIIQSIPPFTIHYDIPYKYHFKDYIYDIESPYESLTLTSDDPAHISFDGLWGTFTYPEEYDGTTVYPIITVRDEDGGEMSTILSIRISDDYVPVLVKELPDVTLLEGQALLNHLDLDDYFDDPDKDSLFFTSGNINTEIIIHENHSVDFIAPDDWSGVETVSFRAIDPENARAEDTILVTVLPVNDPPLIEGVPNLKVHYVDPARPSYNYTFDLGPYVNDVDNDTSELLITTSDPSHITFGKASNTLMLMRYPESMRGQTISVRITVSDGLSSRYQDINVTISDDWPPEILKEIPEFEFFEDTSLNYAFNLLEYFVDVDGDALNFSIVSNNVIVSIDENTTFVSFSSIPDWSGTEYVTFRAMDSFGAIAEQTTRIYVIPVNDPPMIQQIPDMTLRKERVYILDLTDYISDIDNELSDLSVYVSSESWETAFTLAGFTLIMNYPSETSDIVHIEVSDGNLTSEVSFRITVLGPPLPSIWEQIYWPWSLLVALLTGLLVFLLAREWFSRITIQEIFLIYANGSLIYHQVTSTQTKVDEDVFSNMLTAIQEFIRDSFRESGDSRVNRIEFGNRKIGIERGEKIYLAVVYTGRETQRNFKPVKEAVKEIEQVYFEELDQWDGFVLKFAGVQRILEKHLESMSAGRIRRGVRTPQKEVGKESSGRLKGLK